jgi:hypothetical protein
VKELSNNRDGKGTFRFRPKKDFFAPPAVWARKARWALSPAVAGSLWASKVARWVDCFACVSYTSDRGCSQVPGERRRISQLQVGETDNAVIRQLSRMTSIAVGVAVSINSIGSQPRGELISHVPLFRTKHCQPPRTSPGGSACLRSARPPRHSVNWAGSSRFPMKHLIDTEYGVRGSSH